jgi:hypothetical protein
VSLLPVMGTRLDIYADRAARRVASTMRRKRGHPWPTVADSLAASFLDAQLDSIDAALEYLTSVAGVAIKTSPAPFLGQLGPRSLLDWLDITPDAVAARVAAGMHPDEAWQRSATAMVDMAHLEPHVVGRDVVATVANNDPRFVGYARVANPGACDFCKMLAGRGPVYTEDTALETRNGQPYHTKQQRLRKDGTVYEPGGDCQCTIAALPKEGSRQVPTDVPRASRRATEAAYREGARTPERAGVIARELDTLRIAVAEGRGGTWAVDKIARLEREAAMAMFPSPRSLALGVLVRGMESRAYDPSQPRDPKGTPTGGQWTAQSGMGLNWANALKVDKAAAAKAVEDAAWATQSDTEKARQLKQQAAAAVAARMQDVPAEDLIAALRAVDDADELYIQQAVSDITVERENGDEYVRLARSADGYYYATYETESPVEGWVYTTPGTPEYDQMVREGAVAGLIDKWSQTSNDHDDGSLAIQAAIRSEFGLADAADWQSSTADGTAILRDHGAVLQSYARAMYDATQADLAARGITEVTVHRGTGIKLGDEPNYLTGPATVALRPASSWSTDLATAHEFGQMALDNRGAAAMLTATVPASRVLSTPRTGMGCLSEAEVVLLGGGLDVKVQRL